jgi:hypothetical protein
MYSPKPIRRRAGGNAGDALLESPGAKLTSRKEAIRLLAAHHTPGALDYLLRLDGADDGRGDVHRDIRIAIGRSLREFLDDPRAWTYLAARVHATRDEASSVLETRPLQLAARHRARFGRLVADATDHPDQGVKFRAFAALPEWSPWLAGAAELAAAHVLDLDSGPSWRYAMFGLVTIFGDGAGSEATATTIATLATRSDAPDSDCGAQRDRPSRQRLAALVGQLTTMDRAERTLRAGELTQAAARLGQTPADLELEIVLRLATTDLMAPTGALRDLVARLDGRPVAAVNAAAALATEFAHNRARWTPDALIEPTERLIANGSLAAALLALELVKAAGPRSGWHPTWRRLLRRLRQSPDPDARCAALQRPPHRSLSEYSLPGRSTSQGGPGIEIAATVLRPKPHRLDEADRGGVIVSNLHVATGRAVLVPPRQQDRAHRAGVAPAPLVLGHPQRRQPDPTRPVGCSGHRGTSDRHTRARGEHQLPADDRGQHVDGDLATVYPQPGVVGAGRQRNAAAVASGRHIADQCAGLAFGGGVAGQPQQPVRRGQPRCQAAAAVPVDDRRGGGQARGNIKWYS